MLFGSIAGDQGFTQDPYQAVRQEMVERYIKGAGVNDERVLQAMGKTPRHEFVPESLRERAYFDMALPIGSAQTISSPFIVALMTEALDPQPTDTVLEIGTGSGYQAAVLSSLVDRVYSIEIVEELGERAAEVLKRLGYENVFTRVGDGFLGWPDAAPFDKIIVTCSPESVPEPLVEQLREGGQIIIPVGERYQQTLYRMTKKDGVLQREALRPTLFVPMTGEAEETRVVKPDPQRPQVVNGDFEESANGSPLKPDFIPGWYYGRQVQRIEATGTQHRAPLGTAFVRFRNETPGLGAHLLQGIPIDGKTIALLRLAGYVRIEDVRQGPSQESLPMIALSLYDEDRQELATFWLGPYRGTMAWRGYSRVIRIPPATREAILRIGLFGATGIADFDQISIEKVN
jgi:protein-L-isoaspartate(D-aspartate) O-methyltransferase